MVDQCLFPVYLLFCNALVHEFVSQIFKSFKLNVKITSTYKMQIYERILNCHQPSALSYFICKQKKQR